MSIYLKISLLIFILFLAGTITFLLRKDKINIKYSILWYILCLILFVVVIIPQPLNILQNLLGFESLVHMLIGLILSLLIFITISLTVIVSSQSKKIVLLIQRVSAYEKKIDTYENKK